MHETELERDSLAFIEARTNYTQTPADIAANLHSMSNIKTILKPSVDDLDLAKAHSLKLRQARIGTRSKPSSEPLSIEAYQKLSNYLKHLQDRNFS